MHGYLAEALRAAPAFQGYDLVLLDCAPNFGLVTKTGIVASDFILVPAKPDYLSTIGIGYLKVSARRLAQRYNEAGAERNGERIDPRFAGVSFAMTQVRSELPVIAQRSPIENLRAACCMRVLESSVRSNPSYFAEAGESGDPAVAPTAAATPSEGDQGRPDRDRRRGRSHSAREHDPGRHRPQAGRPRHRRAASRCRPGDLVIRPCDGMPSVTFRAWSARSRLDALLHAPARTGGIMTHDDPEVRELVRRLVAALARNPPPVATVAPGEAWLLDVTVDGVRCRCSRAALPASLSPRELEITRMVAAGQTNQAIADHLGISAWTVATHLRRIFSKLGVNSRAAMVARLLGSESHVRATHRDVSPEDATVPERADTVS
ncbi:LuxR C-terminal-related transcriptional regulator [Actinoplanes sp. RD1]|uniref:LuxR C-terminal-related transcriptional regulator n=1 Tax=Actinoplanes sp. RD1 TaxID=3064538 RepID=UPI0027423CE9|nr:LuxR C-terminal-related transcriptional regulator [Actinoplanes sp. RD1]